MQTVKSWLITSSVISVSKLWIPTSKQIRKHPNHGILKMLISSLRLLKKSRSVMMKSQMNGNPMDLRRNSFISSASNVKVYLALLLLSMEDL